jgi:hypothetical protein
MATNLKSKIQQLLDHNAATNAVTCFVGGLDLPSESLVRSAFFPDAVVDLTPVNKLGFSFGVLNGKDAITEHVMAGVGSIDSSHHVSNIRVNINGDEVHLTCYFLAQHFRLGEGAQL